MNSDDFFDGDDYFDAAALQQLDAIEAAHFLPAQSTKSTTTTARDPATSPVVAPKASTSKLGGDSSFCDLSFEIDETDYAQLDNFIADSYQGKAKPVAGPSRTSSSNKLQTTLFGDVLPPTPTASSSKPKSQITRTKSATRNVFGHQAKKTKQWDQTQFSKTGIRKAKSAKGKGKYDDDEDEETLEFEQFPAPFVPSEPPPPMKLQPDLLEAKHWIYPLNRPKRDYQYNIVKNSLFENTLVALPTGLGKTFIAGAVMLNFYRWFPEGKVVFVAPTKPLVAQQISACHETCGIPGRDSIELNGEIPVATRARYWKEKRVFFMTPQTVVNDLTGEICDVRDIVLLVVDEAHRASGDYAYNQVIRFLMAKNPHFRVLALTATPGNSVDSIQNLVDGLHISRIEIRNEESLDLKAYLHKKVFKTHIIKPDENLLKLRDLLAKTMDALMKPLHAAGLLFPGDTAIKMHPFRPQSLMQKRQNAHHFGTLSMLAVLCRAMLYLVAGSYMSCYEVVGKLMDGTPDDGGGGKKKKVDSGKKWRDNPHFRAFMQEFEIQRARGFTAHPKIEKLKNILIQHFASRLPEEGGAEDDTKVMVFSSYRYVVDEIVKELDKERPLLRAARFIGQGTDKQGNKGLGQKEQLDVIKRFKSGEFNVLVATSIGEEGLDIGELDVTICYDSDKAPTRMIQRFGRTGRKREGTIHALLAEGREESNIEKAEAMYKEVQKVVTKGELYELYGDVERLIPDHINPQCVEKVVEIEEYVREEKRKKPTAEKGTKRKRNDAVERNIPDGASTGFVSVRDLVVKGAAKKRKVKDLSAISSGSDEDIESGCIIPLNRRTKSAPETKATEKKVPKSRLKKSATAVPGKEVKSRKKAPQRTLSDLSDGADDTDDLDIEAGTIIPSLRSQLLASVSRAPISRSPTPEAPPIDPDQPPNKNVDASVIELTDSEQDDFALANANIVDDYDVPDFDRALCESPHADQNMSWLVDDDDDDDNGRDFKIIDSSPPPPPPPKRPSQAVFERMQIGDESMEISNPVPFDEETIPTSDPFEPAMDESIEFIEPQPRGNKPTQEPKRTTFSTAFRPSSVLLSPSRNLNRGTPERQKSRFASSSRARVTSSPLRSNPSSPAIRGKGKGKTSMLPPALPDRFLQSPGDSSIEMPEPSFPVRPVGKRRRIVVEVPESPELDMPPPASQRRLQHIESTPVRERRAAKKDKKRADRAIPSLLARNVNPLFDGEAQHSGDEESEGFSEEEEESESDRQFIRDSPLTQASQSYDQSMIYRQSLMTQAPAAVPAFGSRPVRARPFGRIEPRQGRFLPSSSPPPPDDDLDHYHLGSFVVDDDEEISYEL